MSRHRDAPCRSFHQQYEYPVMFGPIFFIKLSLHRDAGTPNKPKTNTSAGMKIHCSDVLPAPELAACHFWMIAFIFQHAAFVSLSEKTS